MESEPLDFFAWLAAMHAKMQARERALAEMSNDQKQALYEMVKANNALLSQLSKGAR